MITIWTSSIIRSVFHTRYSIKPLTSLKTLFKSVTIYTLLSSNS